MLMLTSTSLVAADCDLDITPGGLEKLEAIPSADTAPTPLPSVPTPRPAPSPQSSAPFKAPPLSFLRFPKVGWSL